MWRGRPSCREGFLLVRRKICVFSRIAKHSRGLLVSWCSRQEETRSWTSKANADRAWPRELASRGDFLFATRQLNVNTINALNNSLSRDPCGLYHTTMPPANNIWEQMGYVAPRGACNHKLSVLSAKCPCLRFMIHPHKVSPF